MAKDLQISVVVDDHVTEVVDFALSYNDADVIADNLNEEFYESETDFMTEEEIEDYERRERYYVDEITISAEDLLEFIRSIT